jgi:ribonuclease HI
MEQKQKQEQAKIRVFCDGSCTGNQYKDDRRKARSAAYFPDLKRGVSRDLPGARQTNQRAELDAVILALETLQKMGKQAENVDIYCDSLYAIHFAKKEWKVGKKKDGSETNQDMVTALWQAVDAHQGTLTFHHVKGHAGIPENEMVDQLATGKVKDF